MDLYRGLRSKHHEDVAKRNPNDLLFILDRYCLCEILRVHQVIRPSGEAGYRAALSRRRSGVRAPSGSLKLGS